MWAFVRRLNINPSEHYRLFCILLLGFQSGLPFLLTLSTLSFWLAETGASKSTIGTFMCVSLPYSLKFMWAPIFDHWRIPWLSKYLGHHRSWLVILQCFLAISLIGLGTCQPSTQLLKTAFFALGVSFFSASQDVIIDGYRIETIQGKNAGLAAAFETIGFRLGMLVSGAGVLFLAHIYTWFWAYTAMAGLILMGSILTMTLTPPSPHKAAYFSQDPLEEKDAVGHGISLKTLFHIPWKHFPHKQQLPYVLLLIFLFKFSDTALNAMSSPFLCDLGITKVTFAQITKIFGVSLMVLGGLSGGIIIQRIGVEQSVLYCALLQAVSALMFAIQATVGSDLSLLIMTIGVESFCSGLTSAIFLVLLSQFCAQPYTMTHFTLLYSFGSLCRVITSVFAGWVADHMGWAFLFLLCASMAIPLIWVIQRLNHTPRTRATKTISPKIGRLSRHSTIVSSRITPFS